MIFVKVQAPAGRNIYVGGDYDNSKGLAPLTIILEAGTHTFETVFSKAVDFRAEVQDVPDGTNLKITLDAVSPPEPI